MSLFKLITCPYCDSNNWDQVGLVYGVGKESIQAQCNDCTGVFEMVVSERREYDNYKHLKKGTDIKSTSGDLTGTPINTHTEQEGRGIRQYSLLAQYRRKIK